MKKNVCQIHNKPFAKSCVSCTQKGRHFSPRTEFKKGQIPWNKGNKGQYNHAEDVKKRISLSLTGRKRANVKFGSESPHWQGGPILKTAICEFCEQQFTRIKKKTVFIGRFCSNSCKMKFQWIDNKNYRESVSSAMKNHWQDKEYREKTIKAILDGARRKPSSLEHKILMIIEMSHYPFMYVGNSPYMVNGYAPDFININRKKVILANGTYWHIKHVGREHLTRAEIEKIECKSYEEAGYKVLHIWEDERLEIMEEKVKNFHYTL